MLDRTIKVIAYITRNSKDGSRELLVFEHRDYPDAGIQVPAGTVKAGELPEVAVIREVEEETGLADCRLLAKLGVYDWFNPYTGQVNERHVFHLAAPAGTEDSWTWVETDGGRVPELEGYVFLLRWVGLDEPLELAGEQGDYLGAIR
jgi:8-oxo-dGTP diphosphatase